MSNACEFEIKDGVLLKYTGTEEMVIVPDGVKEIARGVFNNCTSAKKIIFPNSLKKFKMFAVSNCKSLIEVELPEGLKEIGSHAFCDCTSLFSINIPNSIKKICNSAFENCVSLKAISFPEGLEEIASKSFLHCIGLETVVLPETVKEVGSEAFSVCANLTSLTINSQSIKLGWGAFNHCDKLKMLNVTGVLNGIKNSVFSKSKFLCKENGMFIYDNTLCCVDDDITNITIPDTVKIIGGEVFCYCKNLPFVAIPETVTEIVPSAFWNCENLSCVQLPTHFKNVSEIKSFFNYGGPQEEFLDRHGQPCEYLVAPGIECSAFKNDEYKISAIRGFTYAPTAYTDENVIQTYEKYIRSQRKKLYHIAVNCLPLLRYMTENGIIPLSEFSDVMDLANKNGNAEATALLLNYQNTQFTEEKKEEQTLKKLLQDPASATMLNKLWSTKSQSDGSLMITGYKGTETEVVVPASIGKKIVSAVGDYAFSPWADRISAQQREFRRKITSVIFSDGISRIGKNIFYLCDNLDSVILPEGLKSIENDAFGECKKLSSVKIPDSVKKISEGAFIHCESLIKLNLPVKMSQIGIAAFKGCYNLTQMNLPSGLKKISRLAFNACKFTKVSIPEGVKTIEDSAFYGCSNLIEVSIPASVTCIEEDAFSKCNQLIIRGATSSYAEIYAKENDIPFVVE